MKDKSHLRDFLPAILLIALAAPRPILADLAVDIQATLKQAKEYFTQQQHDRAFPLLQTAAEAGDLEAMRYLGLMMISLLVIALYY